MRKLLILLAFLPFVLQGQVLPGVVSGQSVAAAVSGPPACLNTNTFAWFEDDYANVTDVGGRVISTWNDLSPNDNDVAAPGESYRPTWTASGIDFATDDILWKLSISNNQPMTIYIVINNTSFTSGNKIMDIASGVQVSQYDSGGQNRLSLADGAEVTYSTVNLSTGTNYLIRVEYNGVNSEIQVDNNSPEGGTTMSSNLSRIVLGGADMLLRAVIIRTISDSSGDITSITDYLNNKY